MPPLTPRTIRIGKLHLRFERHLFERGYLARILVLHQSAPRLFHGNHRGLLRRGGKDRAMTALQLPRAFGGDDDEAISALIGIVRYRAVGVITNRFGHNVLSS